MIIMLMLILATIFREESMITIAMIILMILPICINFQSYTLLVVILSNLLLVLVTIMKEEVISVFSMFLIILSCKYLLIICIGICLFAVIFSIIKCQCIGRELNFVVAYSLLCVALYLVSH